MWRRLSPWRGREPVPDRRPPDREKLAHMGAALRSSYGSPEEHDRLDDHIVALMLELSVDEPEQIMVRQRVRS